MKKQTNFLGKLFAIALLSVGVFSLTSCNRERQYHVTFDYNVDKVEDLIIDVSMEDGKLEIPSIGNVTKDGYVFEGWTLEDGTAITEETIITSSITIYAKWHAIPKAPTISFNELTNVVTVSTDSEDYTNKLYVKRNSEEVEEVTLTKKSAKEYTYTVTKPGTYEAYATSSDTLSTSKNSDTKQFTIAEPDYNVLFMDGTTQIGSAKLNEDHTLTLISNPQTTALKKFVGWYLDSEFRVAYDASKASEVGYLFETFDSIEEPSAVNLYAKFETLDELTKPTDISVNSTYTKVTFTDTNENVKYKVVVKKGDTVIEESSEYSTSKEFALTRSKYEQGSTYTVTVNVKADVKDYLNNDRTTSETSSFEVTTYAYTVKYYNYADDTEAAFEDGHNANSYVKSHTATRKSTDTTHIFTGWVLKDTTTAWASTTQVTSDLVYVGKWEEITEDDANLTYNSTDSTITFAEFTYADAYLTFNGVTTKVTSPYHIFVEGLGIEDSVTSSYKLTYKGKVNSTETVEFSSSADYTYTASKVLVKFIVGDEYSIVEVPSTGYLTTEQIATVNALFESNGTTSLVGYNYDGVYGSALVNLTTKRFTVSTIIKAVIVENPDAIDSSAISYTCEDGKVYATWTAVEGASKYLVKFGNDTSYTEVTTNKIVTPVTVSGNYPIYIKYVKEGITSLELSGQLVVSLVENYNKSTVVNGQDSEGNAKKVAKVIVTSTIGDSSVDTTIRYAGQKYNIGSMVFPESIYYTVEDGILTMTTNQEYFNIPFAVTYNNGTNDVTENYMVVANLQNATITGSYATFETEKDNETLLNSTSAYKLGTSDDTYALELNLQFQGGFSNATTTTSGDNNTLYVSDTSTLFTTVIKLDGEVTSKVHLKAINNKYYLVFDEVIDEGTLTLSLTPTYIRGVDSNNELTSASSIEYTFELNKGVNVYDNDALTAAIANTDLEIVNLHTSSITVYAKDEQLLGSEDDDSLTLTNFTGDYENGLKGKINGDIYTRECADGSTFTLNGNGCTIDASNVPGVYNKSLSRENESSATKGYQQRLPYSTSAADNVYLQSMHIGIFRFNGQGDYYGRQLSEFATNNLNDLIVIGNANGIRTKYADRTSNEVAARLTGAIPGVITPACSLNTFNCNFSECLMAVHSDDYSSTEFVSSYTKTNNNAYYGYFIWGGSLKLSHCEIKDNGGMGIFMADAQDEYDTTPAYCDADKLTSTFIRRDPCLMLDNNTTIECWVDGTEAFYAYNALGGVIPSLKVDMQQSLLSTVHKSVLKTANNTSKFNFAVLFNGSEAAGSRGLGQYQYVYYNSDTDPETGIDNEIIISKQAYKTALATNSEALCWESSQSHSDSQTLTTGTATVDLCAAYAQYYANWYGAYFLATNTINTNINNAKIQIAAAYPDYSDEQVTAAAKKAVENELGTDVDTYIAAKADSDASTQYIYYKELASIFGNDDDELDSSYKTALETLIQPLVENGQTDQISSVVQQVAFFNDYGKYDQEFVTIYYGGMAGVNENQYMVFMIECASILDAGGTTYQAAADAGWDVQ